MGVGCGDRVGEADGLGCGVEIGGGGTVAVGAAEVALVSVGDVWASSSSAGLVAGSCWPAQAVSRMKIRLNARMRLIVYSLPLFLVPAWSTLTVRDEVQIIW